MEHQLDDDKPLMLVFPYDVMAHYIRCIQLAKYFSNYFTIKFLFSHRYQSFIEKAGFETFECATLDAEKVQQCVERFNFSWLNEEQLKYIYEQQVQVINELRPTVVLGDMAPTLKMAAEKTGVQYISLHNGYLSRYYKGARKMPRRFALYKLFSLLPGSVYNFFRGVGEDIYFHDLHQPFRKIRKHQKLQQQHSYLDELEGDINFITDDEILFPQKRLPTNYFFIPPLFNQLVYTDDSITYKIDKTRRTILVSMGSTGDWNNVSFLNDEAYRKYNIVTVGDKNKVVNNDRVIAIDFTEDANLFANVDLVICHGGNGTCYQALSFGIPLLCFTSHLEQEYNVQALEQNCLAKSLNDLPLSKLSYVVDEWANKKGNKEFEDARQRINKLFGSMEETLIPIMQTLLPHTHLKDRTLQLSLLR